MSKKEIKRLVILNIPYLILGLLATNLGEAWRLARRNGYFRKIVGVLLHSRSGFLPIRCPASTLPIFCRAVCRRMCPAGSLSERKKC